MTTDLFPFMVSPHWQRVSKADPRCRNLADRHYTRQHPGTPMFTRPGYNAVLYSHGPTHQAVWCWWRPKWESGIPGTERKDRLRVIECTLFRLETTTAHRSPLTASILIQEAVAALASSVVARDLHLAEAGTIDCLITAVGIRQTSRRRSRHAPPGQCYRVAGWMPFDHPSSDDISKTWLSYPMPTLTECINQEAS